MRSEKRKKSDELGKSAEGQPTLASTRRYRFNTSSDNLRSLMGLFRSRKSRRSFSFKVMPSQHAVQGQSIEPVRNFSSSIGLITEKNHDIIKPIRNVGVSPDLSREVSNQILKKIQRNGVHYVWKDEESQIETQQHEQQQSHDSLWKVFSEKFISSSRASTMETQPVMVERLSCSFEQCAVVSNDYNPYYDSSQASQIDSIVRDYSQFYGNFQQNCEGITAEQSLVTQHYQFYSNCQSNYAQYQIYIDCIGADPRTTLMIKNIPNKYTIQNLSGEIDQHFSNTYDFLYLPWDIKNNCNVGYGFINFISTDILREFYLQFHNQKWLKFKSEKICMLNYARLQGLSSLIEHFENSKVLNNKDKKYQPIIRFSLSKITKMISQQQQKKAE